MSAHIEIHDDPAYVEPLPIYGQKRRSSKVAPVLREVEPNSLGCTVALNPDGLVITSVVAFGWGWACGLEVDDLILSINDEPARRPEDLRRAILDVARTAVVLETTTPTGGLFRFCLPLPLGRPEMHCMGFLFDQDPKAGFHVVVGLLRHSAAANCGLVNGCCIRRIDGFPIHGRTEAEVRKMIFGGFDIDCVLSIQLPGEVELREVHVPRMHTALIEDEDGDAFYSDGWSEKQFDTGACCSKCFEWARDNSLHLAGDDRGGAITGEFPAVPMPDGDLFDVLPNPAVPTIDEPNDFAAPTPYNASLDQHGQQATDNVETAVLSTENEVLKEIESMQLKISGDVHVLYSRAQLDLSTQVQTVFDHVRKAQMLTYDILGEHDSLHSSLSALDAQVRYLETAMGHALRRIPEAHLRRQRNPELDGGLLPC
jgi:hypothetical protein